MTRNGGSHLYLSRLVLNPESWHVRSELANAYEMHRTLMCAFPQASTGTKQGARENFGVLFRADQDDKQRCVKLYVQSFVRPDWSFLDGRAGYLVSAIDPPKDVGPIYQKLEEGQVVSFRLRANPTKRVWHGATGAGALHGQRIGLRTEKEQIEWLARKGRRALHENEKYGGSGGFELVLASQRGGDGQAVWVPRVRIQCEGIQSSQKRGKSPTSQIKHLAVRFDGILRITDANAFCEVIASGIGPAKAFGFGLLSIAPAGSVRVPNAF